MDGVVYVLQPPGVSYIRAKYRFCPRVNDMTLAYRTYLALKVQIACEAKVLNSFSSAMYTYYIAYYRMSRGTTKKICSAWEGKIWRMSLVMRQ